MGGDRIMAISQAELIRRVAALATELYVGGSRIFPSVRLAQTILETGGKVPFWNNIFGIKVGTGEETPYWDGRYVNRTTREVFNGQVYDDVVAQWRYYSSIEDSVRDHELFLQKPRYAAVRAAATPLQQCQALYTAGYATDAPASVDGDPSYWEKLWSIILSRGFTSYDTEAARLKKDLEDRLAALATELDGLKIRSGSLEQLSRVQTVPEWAREPVSQAVSQGLVDTPEGGSHDFYRVLTVMRRKGLL
jgi:flagellum-specific peptidoglycan hydrolase FlgJ